MVDNGYIMVTGWCPPVISWFINPMNTIVLSTINHSEMGVINHQLSDSELGHHLVIMVNNDQGYIIIHGQ